MRRYIDAEKLKAEFDYEHIDMNKTAAVVHHCHFLEIINQQPTADVRENVHGEWVDVKGDGSMWACSLCGDEHCFKNFFCHSCQACRKCYRC